MNNKKNKNEKIFKIIFQSSNPNTFRSTSIGYLYQVTQKHRVILLVEKIDSYTKKILYDKKLFPGLEKIILFESPFIGNIFRKNYNLYKIFKKIIYDYNPDIVIAPSDIWPAEMYLMRFAKQIGAITIAIQDGFRISEKKNLFLFSCLSNSYKMFSFLPFTLRLFFIRIKKYIAHFLYYWILPLTVGEIPFIGKTSFIFWDEASGLRDADYCAIFSKREYDLCVKDKVRPEKLFIVGHPLQHKSTKKFFESVFFLKNKEKEIEKVLTIMWPDINIGFKKRNYTLITEENMNKNRIRIIKLINENLPGWKIFIKPHPSVKNISEIKEIFGSLSDNISIVDPLESADKYIEISKVIIGIPLPSTTIFTASLQNLKKIILFLDLSQEFLGDSYKDFKRIEYIDNEENFIKILKLIRNNKYYVKPINVSNSDFSSVNELLNHIYSFRF